MEINREQIASLVRNPAESLNVEVKRWIDPDSEEGKAKIIRACLALRNRNGGYFVVGFNDGSMKVDDVGCIRDPRESFNLDKIQTLISAYASNVFEIAVEFQERDGFLHPVIVVPSGVQIPVAAKKELSFGGRNIIKRGDVYFRTLGSNGTVSTSVACCSDWADIFNICFENRELDIGRFLRRQLSGIDASKIAEIRDLIGGASLFAVRDVVPSLRDKVENLIERSEKRFLHVFHKKQLAEKYSDMLGMLAWHVGVAFDPPWVGLIADNIFIGDILACNPQYTGWPVWLDSRFFNDKEARPVREADGWGALISPAIGGRQRLEFMRFEPAGHLYLRRVLEDDLHSEKVAPHTALDPLLVIIRVAEAIAVALSIAQGMRKKNVNSENVGIAFRWCGLSDRILRLWANPTMGLIGEPRASVDDVSTFVEVPCDVPINAIAPFVTQATRELFAVFDGTVVNSAVIEDWTARLLERRLNL